MVEINFIEDGVLLSTAKNIFEATKYFTAEIF